MRSAGWIGLVLLGLGACATPAPLAASDFVETRAHVRVMVMKPDVEVRHVTTAGGELRADWTRAAETHLVVALIRQLEAGGETVSVYPPDKNLSEAGEQALLLNQAVSSAMMTHAVQVDPQRFAGRLPHKQAGELDYSLGEAAAALAGGQQVDYFLFLTSRANFESSGVAMTKIVLGAVTGVLPLGGGFRGTMVSLVDMQSGDVVWLGSSLQGDPRDPDQAASIMQQVFETSPLK